MIGPFVETTLGALLMSFAAVLYAAGLHAASRWTVRGVFAIDDAAARFMRAKS